MSLLVHVLFLFGYAALASAHAIFLFEKVLPALWFW